MSSAFSAACFIDRMLLGMGGHWISFLEKFMERKKLQGIDGIRVFGETTFWDDRDDNPNNDHPFFNQYRCTSERMWDFTPLSNQHRPSRLTGHNQLLILTLLELCQKHELKLEYVTDATMKHSGRGIGWDIIGHCIRETAYFLNCVDHCRWDDDHLGVTDRFDVTERIREKFENIKKPIRDWVIHETHNEWDAHSVEAWNVNGFDRAQALNEVNNQSRRHHTKEDHWPSGIVGVSHGGRDDIEYRVGPPNGTDYVAVHPSRSGEWSQVGSRFSHLERHGAPVYMNETKHFIDPSYWWTVEQGWFRPQSSTRDVERVLRFEQDCLDKGYSFCRHDLVGMACGMWVDGDTYVEMDRDAREKATAGSDPEPGRYLFARPIRQAYLDILDREPDPAGLASYDALMGRGTTEAMVRESLIRSEEYRNKNS